MQRAVQNTRPARASWLTMDLRKLGGWRGIRVLAWHGNDLYACCGYGLLRLDSRDIPSGKISWRPVARFRPEWWRTLTARNSLAYRLVRDGFHGLAIAGDQSMIAAVPGAIITRDQTGGEFKIAHKVVRGTRPLHITAIPGGNIYWGEYFDNRGRAEVHIYASADSGQTWHVAHTFPAGAIRHVHNVTYDCHCDCLWILTGDDGAECKVLRADRDLRNVDVVLSGNQQARAVAVVPTQDALYLSTDTPFEKNHVFRLDRGGHIEAVGELSSSSIFGCQTANALFFSTMAEPSRVNTTRDVHLVGSTDGSDWHIVASWQKDVLPMHYFQYGNVILPDGENSTNYLAATSIAVKDDDLVTTLWEVTTNNNLPPDANSDRRQHIETLASESQKPRAESRSS